MNAEAPICLAVGAGFFLPQVSAPSKTLGKLKAFSCSSGSSEYGTGGQAELWSGVGAFLGLLSPPAPDSSGQPASLERPGETDRQLGSFLAPLQVTDVSRSSLQSRAQEVLGPGWANPNWLGLASLTEPLLPKP